MAEADKRAFELGTHELLIEGDSIEWKVHGLLHAKDLEELIEHSIQVKRACKCVFVLYDARQCTGIDPSSRLWLSKAKRNTEAYADLRVAFGIPFGVRVVVNMILHTQRLLLGQPIEMHIFEDEAVARAFFVKERDRLREVLNHRSSV